MIIKELDIGSPYQRDNWNKHLKQGKIKAEFSDENAANQYVNWLKSKNIDAEIHPYSWGGPISFIVDINRHKSVNNQNLQEVNKGYTASVQSVLDDLYVDNGKIIEDYLVDNINLFLFNTYELYTEIKNKRRKSYSIAYEAMLELFQINVDDYLDGNKVRVKSDMIKRWLNKYGVDFKQLLIPIVEKIDEKRAEIFGENIKLKETWLDDEDSLDSGDIVYEGKAYYNKRYSGLAHSEQFSDASDMYDWVWRMCQDGYYVTVYDYEDGEYSYYKWPDNAEYMDLSSVEQLETDERGNFLYIDDIELK
jgi:hypothetical protein